MRKIALLFLLLIYIFILTSCADNGPVDTAIPSVATTNTLPPTTGPVEHKPETSVRIPLLGTSTFESNYLILDTEKGYFRFDGAPETCNSESQIGKLRIIKFDSENVQIWENIYEDLFSARYMFSMVANMLSDGGFIAIVESGEITIPDIKSYEKDAYLVRFDSNGNVQWKQRVPEGSKIKYVSEVENKEIITIGINYSKFSSTGSLIQTVDHIDTGYWNYYKSGVGIITSTENHMYCYDLDYNLIWELRKEGIVGRPLFFEDAIYWGGGGMDWEKGTLYKISYSGNEIWHKSFDGITYPLYDDMALVYPEGEWLPVGENAIQLINLESGQIINKLEILKPHLTDISVTDEGFTLSFTDYTGNGVDEIVATYDKYGNLLDRG